MSAIVVYPAFASTDHRLIVWPCQKAHAVEQPTLLRLATAGMSFTHAGYTQAEPNGRSAQLFVTAEVARQALSPAERAAANEAGLNLDTRLSVTSNPSWSLDLSISDPGELARIERGAHLPMQVVTGTIPLQITWTNVAGDTLYDWLTNSQTGLVLRLSAEHRLSLDLKRTIVADGGRLAQWIATLPPDSAVWHGDLNSLGLSMINAGVFLWRDTGTNVADVDVAAVAALAERLALLVSAKGDGTSAFSSPTLGASDWTTTVNCKSAGSAMVAMSASPGQLLRSRPELVRDLSGAGVGLEAIRGR